MTDLITIVAALRSDEEKIYWEAATAAGDYVEASPETIWPLVIKHGSSDREDKRLAIATCLLEHLLEHHFETYFPMLENEIIAGNVNLRAPLEACWKFGLSGIDSNSERWDKLLKATT